MDSGLTSPCLYHWWTTVVVIWYDHLGAIFIMVSLCKWTGLKYMEAWNTHCVSYLYSISKSVCVQLCGTLAAYILKPRRNEKFQKGNKIWDLGVSVGCALTQPINGRAVVLSEGKQLVQSPTQWQLYMTLCGQRGHFPVTWFIWAEPELKT